MAGKQKSFALINNKIVDQIISWSSHVTIMTIKQLYSYLLLFEIQYLAKTMSSAKLQQKGLECYNCGGPNNLCSGKILCLIHGCLHIFNIKKYMLSSKKQF